MKKEKSIFPLPPESLKTLECRANLKLNRVLATEATATIPMVVVQWGLAFGRMNHIRTLCHMKYLLDTTGSGMCVVDHDRMAQDLQTTRQTVYNHIKVLHGLGMINPDPRVRNGWFLRSWKLSIKRAYDELYPTDLGKPKRSSKEAHCVFPVKYVGSKSGFKAAAMAHLIGQSLRSQERGRRNNQSRIVEKTERSCTGGALSAEGVGRMLRGSKMWGSRMRRLAIDHGWLSMKYQFTPTPYTRWHLDRARSGEVELHGIERMRLFGDAVWSEQCPWLDELTRELRVVRRVVK